MDHKPRQGDHRYQCRYCNKSFVVATMTTHHENNAQCPEAQQAAYEREHRAQ